MPLLFIPRMFLFWLLVLTELEKSTSIVKIFLMLILTDFASMICAIVVYSLYVFIQVTYGA